jgi:hypothetical protein
MPKYRHWDRYDYLDPSSNWNAPFVRGTYAGSNNGMTLDQILGYRAILINTGTLPAGCMQDEDWGLFAQWLTTSRCGANENRQYIHVNGDKTGEALLDPGGPVNEEGPAFMSNFLCASLFCTAFNGYVADPNCAPESQQYCVDWEWTGDPAGFPEILDVVLYGSYCPNLYGFNVFEPIGDGFCNRALDASLDPTLPPKYMECGQVLCQDLTPSANYRAAIDGASWHHMTLKDPAGTPPDGYCPRDPVAQFAAIASEIGAAMLWGFSIIPNNDPAEYTFDKFQFLPRLTSAEELAGCQGTWDLPIGVDEDGFPFRANRLYQNRPNPFNPTTEIRFSLAQTSKVEVAIYDVNGRLIKTLVDGKEEAGLHSVVWDGTNDSGNKVGSGVYWSRMKTEKFTSNKQMVILK